MAAPFALLQGVYTALVTPFRAGRVDETAFTRLLEEQVAGGVDGVVPVGTTGESPTLDMEEHLRVIELAVRVINGRVKVFAGTGSNSTTEAIHLTLQAEKLGADGFLVVSPYYNKPSQAGLFAHYAALAEASPLPIITYSVPGRTGGEIAVETMASLARTHANIVAIKEAGGSIERFSQLRQALPETVAILSGDDSMTLPALAVGANGVVSVASNLIPREVGAMVRAFLEHRPVEAEQVHRKFYPLFRDLFIEPNPVPAKFALAKQGWMTAEVRLPLVAMSPAMQVRLEDTLGKVGWGTGSFGQD
jgi:4-hydroxy-tetrahydrodipicolinate synthase